MQQQDKESEIDEECELDKESEINLACELMFEYFYNYKFEHSRGYLYDVHRLLDDFERALDGREAEHNQWEEELMQQVCSEEEAKELNIK